MSKSTHLAIYILVLCLLFVRIILFPGKGLEHSNSLNTISHSNSVIAKLSEVNQRILPEPAAGLVSGVLWGEKAAIPTNSYKKLQTVGLTHVVVASGMNLVFLVGLIGIFFGRNQRTLFLPVLLGTVIYCFITDWQIPIVRAAVMIIFVQVAGLSGRPVMRFWPLILAAVGILFLWPDSLWSVSFQLSFLAMAGQISLGLLAREIRYLNGSLVSGLAQTVFAQIFTLPILFINFGSYSLVSILANILVLWTVPWLMTLGLVAGILGMVFEPVGRLVGLPLQTLSIYFWEVVTILGSRPNFLLRVAITDTTIYLGYYLVLAGAFWLVKRRLGIKLI